MNMKKHVCMIGYTNYKSDARVRREAETLAATGDFEVSFLALKEEESARPYELEKIEVIELNVKKFRGQNKISHFLSYMNFFSLAFFKCSNFLLTRKLDIIHIHNMPNFLVFTGLIPRLFGKKMILDIHDSTPETYYARYKDNPNRFLYKLLCLEEALCCAFVNKIICVNHIQRDKLVKRGIPLQKIVISMNVPDPKWFAAEPVVRDNKSKNNIKLIYHGTIAKRLGIDLAIRAFYNVCKENSNMEFYILGDGEAMNECIELSKNLGLDNKIHFSKKILPIELLLGILKDMDVGVVANRRNSATELMLPVKLLEYVALGIPAVVPKLKAIENYFTDEMVSYFEPDNIESFTNSLSGLCANENKRKVQAEKAKAFLNHYGWENHKMDLINLYKEI